MSTAEKHALDFEVLSDIGSDVAREYGIVYKLTDDVAAIYEEKSGSRPPTATTPNELRSPRPISSVRRGKSSMPSWTLISAAASLPRWKKIEIRGRESGL